MLGEKKLKQIADKVLSPSKADETEVILIASESALTRFANSRIHQSVASEDISISIRTVVGKKIGVAAGNSVEVSALEILVKQALELTELQKEDPYFVSLPSPSAIHKIENDIEYVTPEQRASRVGTVIKKASVNKIIASGAFQSVVSEIAIANSKGIWAYHVSSACDLSTILLGESSTGFAAQVGKKLNDINAEEIADTAIEKVLKGKDPKAVKPGKWEVILEPQAVNEMMSFFAWLGPNARMYHDQASYLSDKMGEKVSGENITIFDDPLAPESITMPFDFEGYPKEKLTIIEKGILKNVTYDSYLANRYQKKNTGHALPAPNTFGPIPLHLTFAPGTKSRQELIKNVKKGLLVTRLWYVRVLNPKQLGITGMTRDGLFIIENGDIVGAAKNMRFNQSIPDALSNVKEVGKELIPLSSFELEIGSNRMPYLHIEDWNFTSGTTF